MNKDYVIRFASYNDIEDIMSFINAYWSKNHILSYNKKMFTFQYCNDEEVCFVISKNTKTNETIGILGYIPYGNVYKNNKRDIYLALWKVKDGDNLFQGVGLLNFLMNDERTNNIYCAGINPKTFSIYKYLKMNIDKFVHYYVLNSNVEYEIATINHKESENITKFDYESSFVDDVNELDFDVIYNQDYQGAIKNREYIDKRYFKHIYYDYKIIKIETIKGKAYFVGREQRYNNSTAFRIVEIWGKEEAIEATGKFFYDFLASNKYEYADCYQFGIDELCMKKAGFLKIEENDSNIIPNYFEPFVNDNIEINICYPNNVKTRMFKGDGDQDRPNKI